MTIPHSSIDEYVGYWFFLTVMNNADMKVYEQVCWLVFSFLEYMSRSKLLGSYDTSG